jgi:hypothetical protein
MPSPDIQFAAAFVGYEEAQLAVEWLRGAQAAGRYFEKLRDAFVHNTERIKHLEEELMKARLQK